MQQKRPKVYCAGPLFTAKEKEEMEQLATALEQHYDTFLPQRDGLELLDCVAALVERGVPPENAATESSKAIFALDVYQVLIACDGLIVNLNGRVPDEGAVSEVAMAWAWGKPVVGYKADVRSAFGGRDNPLVVGLLNFVVSASMEDVVSRLQGKMNEASTPPRLPWQVRQLPLYGDIQLGESIWQELQRSRAADDIAELLVSRASSDVYMVR